MNDQTNKNRAAFFSLARSSLLVLLLLLSAGGFVLLRQKSMPNLIVGTAKAASGQTWYVRPLVYSGQHSSHASGTKPAPDPGVYGTQDGTSYANAWNGLTSVVWGAGGVQAGDSLYVCGTHSYTTAVQDYFATQAEVDIGASGTADSPITIRGDCQTTQGQPDDGIIWGVWKDNIVWTNGTKVSGVAEWTGPDANGVYSTTQLRYGAVAVADGNTFHWLHQAPGTTWTGNPQGDPGAVYNVPNVDSPWMTDATYVKMADGSNPTGKIYSGGSGFQFNVGTNNYINFYKLKFYGSDLSKSHSSAADPSGPAARHITIDSCDMRYSEGILINLYTGNDYWTVKNSELHDANSGIYTMTQYGPGAEYLTADGNYIHDMGTIDFPGADAHAVGVQGGAHHLIQNNTTDNTGSAIEFWTQTYPMTDMTVRNNFIKNVYIKSVTGGSGIVVSGQNENSLGQRTGFKIYNNIIMNTGLGGATQDWQGAGIGSNNKDLVQIYNNVIVNARTGIRFGVVGAPVLADVRNNMIINPSLGYVNVAGDNTPWTVTWDNNLYYPAVNMSSGFSFGQAVSHDQHSVFADPNFVSVSPAVAADFALRSGSPAIDTGSDVGLTADFVGNSIIGLPDIGAYEYQPPSPTPTATPTATPTPIIYFSGGGGGGGSSFYPTPTPTPVPTILAAPSSSTTISGSSFSVSTSASSSAMTKDQLIVYLKGRIAYLLKLLAQMVGSQSASSVSIQSTTKLQPLTRQLWYGLSGEDVRTLQVFLNTHGYIIAQSGSGSPGQESTFFGPAVKAAVIKFQQANGITALGGVGAATLEKVNALMMH